MLNRTMKHSIVIHTYGSDRQADQRSQHEKRQSYQTHVSICYSEQKKMIISKL